MTEVKFLKDLPIKFTNTNKRVLNIIGGDIYYDSHGNRYGYITFNNVSRSPIFSLQLYIREYSIEGKFIKDTEFFEPYIYYPTGNFVTNEPIPLDKETEAVEITIVKVTLDSHNFINDKFSSFKNEDFTDLYQRKAPIKKPGTATSFSLNSSVNSAPRGNVEYEDGAAPEGGSALSIERENAPTELKQFGSAQKDLGRFIYPAIGLIFLIIFVVVLLISVQSFPNFDLN